MYHLSVLPPKQHKIPLIVSSQISIPNASPNLTDTQIAILDYPCRPQHFIIVVRQHVLRSML